MKGSPDAMSPCLRSSRQSSSAKLCISPLLSRPAASANKPEASQLAPPRGKVTRQGAMVHDLNLQTVGHEPAHVQVKSRADCVCGALNPHITPNVI